MGRDGFAPPLLALLASVLQVLDDLPLIETSYLMRQSLYTALPILLLRNIIVILLFGQLRILVLQTLEVGNL